MAVKILEEALSVQAVFAHNLLETVNDSLNINMVNFLWSFSSIDSLSTRVSKRKVDILFKSFFGKDFINCVTEVSPSDVFTFFWCLESAAQQCKFRG